MIFSEKETKTSICCSTYLCIHWLLLICALTEIEIATLTYQEDALTNWATWPGLRGLFNCHYFPITIIRNKGSDKVGHCQCLFSPDILILLETNIIIVGKEKIFSSYYPTQRICPPGTSRAKL